MNIEEIYNTSEGANKMELLSSEKMRKEWSESDAERDAGLTTPETIKRYDNIAYGSHGVWNLMDIYHTKDVKEPQPAIISIHGGGWVYGTKEIYQFYGMGLAQRGFTVVNFNYRLAPEDPYPAALEDINALFTWVGEHGKEYQIDVNNLFVVGDSAGGQFASQYLAMLANEEYRKFYQFQMPVNTIRIKAAGLNCGAYDVAAQIEEQAGGVLAEYLGRDYKDKLPALDTMKYLNEDFPPSFIMTSYHDFLRKEAKPMYDALTALGIPCKLKEYGAEDKPEIAHVFHINMRLEEAKQCNDDECKFFRGFIN